MTGETRRAPTVHEALLWRQGEEPVPFRLARTRAADQRRHALPAGESDGH